MLVYVNAYTFDLGGSVLLDCMARKTTAGEQVKRVNRIGTLDGSAAFNDFGFSQADRAIELVWTPDQDADAIVERVHQLHSRVTVSLEDGVFLGYPETYAPGRDENRWRILVESKLS